MMNERFRIIGIALSLLSPAVMANHDYQQELMRMDADALAFTQAERFVAVNPESLTDERYYSKANFPALSSGQGSMRLPDADLDAATRSILILEAQEVQLAHVRYRIRYSSNVSTDFPEARHDYVEVTRFNLGPARRTDLLEFVAAEHVAPAAEFGIGPHVSWRFAMAPVMGMQAGLMYASRSEVAAGQAQHSDCLGEPCLSLNDSRGPELTWNPVVSPQLERPSYHARSTLGSTRPARVMQELWASVTSDGIDVMPYRQDQPLFVFVISLDVTGQDAAVAGLAQQTRVMDHSVKEIWTWRREVVQTPVEFFRMYVPRR